MIFFIFYFSFCPGIFTALYHVSLQITLGLFWYDINKCSYSASLGSFQSEPWSRPVECELCHHQHPEKLIIGGKAHPQPWELLSGWETGGSGKACWGQVRVPETLSLTWIWGSLRKETPQLAAALFLGVWKTTDLWKPVFKMSAFLKYCSCVSKTPMTSPGITRNPEDLKTHLSPQ